MKRLMIVALLAMACGKRVVQVEGAPSGGLPGAASARGAADAFMQSVQAESYERMSLVWGTSEGPTKATMDRTELEKRELVMQRCFKGDRYEIGEESSGQGGARLVRVDVFRGKDRRTSMFEIVQGPKDRWFVQDPRVTSVKDFCGQQQSKN